MHCAYREDLQATWDEFLTLWQTMAASAVEDPAVANFRRYIRINTEQPTPDYSLYPDSWLQLVEKNEKVNDWFQRVVRSICTSWRRTWAWHVGLSSAWLASQWSSWRWSAVIRASRLCFSTLTPMSSLHSRSAPHLYFWSIFTTCFVSFVSGVHKCSIFYIQQAILGNLWYNKCFREMNMSASDRTQ